MNERIKELRNEAEKWVADNFSTDELDPYEWWEKEEQKFAQLIIQDCIKIAYQNDIAKFTRDGYQIGMDIQKHFGVEE